MGKYLLDVPDKLHDQLRHKSIDDKEDIKDMIIKAIEKYLK